MQQRAEADLPRSNTVRQPLKSKRERADEDDLFDDSETEKPTKKKRKPKLIVGAYCLGQITKINALDMIISLPNQLKGIVTITGISEQLSKKAADIANMNDGDDDDDEDQLLELSKLFKVGQWVRCVITRLGNNDDQIKNKQIELSLDPKLVNCDIVRTDISKGMILSASVESIEDHGYVLSIGMSGINVFLHNKEASDYESKFNNSRPLIVGQLLNVSVISAANKNLIIQVTANPDTVSSATLPDKAMQNISSLAPGNLIKARVDKVLDHGIICKYNGMKCEIDFLHLGKIMSSNTQNLNKVFNEGEEITARIVYLSISNETKTIRLSLESHILQLEPSRNVFPIGVQLGEVVKVIITNTRTIKEDIITLSLEPSQIHANLNIAHLSDHLSPTHLSNIVKSLKPGYMLKDLIIISKNDEKGFVNVSNKHLLIEAAKNGKLPKSIQDIEVGSIVPGYVRSITDYAVFIGFLGGFSARAMRHMIADHYVASPAGLFYPQQSVICRVVSIDSENSRCEVSLKLSDTPVTALPYIPRGDFVRTYFNELLPQNGQESLLTIEKKANIGELVKCKVKKQISEHGISGFKVNVLLVDNTDVKIKGFIHEDQVNCKDKEVNENDILDGVVLDLDMKGKQADLAVRSELVDQFKLQNSQPISNKYKKLRKIAKEGTTVDAVIELVKEDYIIVSLPEQWNTIAFAAAKSYNNRTQPFMRYSFGQKVKVQIVHVPQLNDGSNINNHSVIDRILVAFQQASNEEKIIVPNMKSIKDFSPGQKVKGIITAVEKYGVFIKINNSSVSGLCHISKLSEDFVRDVSALYKTGQYITAVILDIDYITQKVAFGIKNSCFKDYGIDLLDESDQDMEDTIDVEDDAAKSNLQMEIDQQNQVTDFSESDNEMVEANKITQKIEITPLPISGAWKWEDEKKTDVPSNNNDDQSNDEKLKEIPGKKKKKKSKTIDAVDKTEDLLKHKPEVNADFERLLLGSPNSSYLWINYMAHQLKLSEIDKAREIGERALKTINYREEQEKMNIWVALMNLENNFGTDESLGDILKRALQACDQKKIYMLLVDIYERSDKKELAKQTYQTMLKKFSQSSKVWTKMGLFHIKNGNVQASRDLLQRSLRSLPKRKHIKAITKFAQMEFKYGEAERGRTIFEGMMSNYSKRVDLWSIYVDMEIKAGDFDIVR
ncbi:2094_t:CDS:10 [Cetraspora pellucida]|uniref:2094_t:CDS:1 n=1 Tax=Cetraspora pellucida TaxID=1433469 RepID=A0A9N9FWA0_9GLOM|nr:2094_t:CDS:10 [Cetraspora pellucida]